MSANAPLSRSPPCNTTRHAVANTLYTCAQLGRGGDGVWVSKCVRRVRSVVGTTRNALVELVGLRHRRLHARREGGQSRRADPHPAGTEEAERVEGGGDEAAAGRRLEGRPLHVPPLEERHVSLGGVVQRRERSHVGGGGGARRAAPAPQPAAAAAKAATAAVARVAALVVAVPASL